MYTWCENKHTSNGINFIKENEAGLLGPGHLEQLTHHSRTLGPNMKQTSVRESKPGTASHLPGLSEPVLSPAYLSHILLHQLRANDADEAGVCAVGHSPGTQRLACAWGAEKQDAFGRLNTQVDKSFRLKEERPETFGEQRQCIQHPKIHSTYVVTETE